MMNIEHHSYKRTQFLCLSDTIHNLSQAHFEENNPSHPQLRFTIHNPHIIESFQHNAISCFISPPRTGRWRSTSISYFISPPRPGRWRSTSSSDSCHPSPIFDSCELQHLCGLQLRQTRRRPRDWILQRLELSRKTHRHRDPHDHQLHETPECRAV